MRKTGPCHVGSELHAGFTVVLYGPWPPEVACSAEARVVVSVDQWLGTRSNNDTAIRQPK